MRSARCRWQEDEDGSWWTQCDEGFTFTVGGGPEGHGFNFCPYCGFAIEGVEWEDEAYATDEDED